MSKKVKNSPQDIIIANALLKFTGVDILHKKSISQSLNCYKIAQKEKERKRLEILKAIDEYLSKGKKIIILPPGVAKF
jgi:hypothetical protein